ncbi:AP-5 complex subunit mu-1-like [Halichondria panicea]|uniref:AP-5 complex subunit mu-1-like n=1 Tax=Halichondria panicea TaxID=6063 RepID=UPI00312B7A8F
MLEAMAELITDPLDLTELRSFLSVCAPFGTPLDLRPSNAINRLTPVPAKVKPLSDLQKSPGWSVGVYRGPPKVTLCIREEIRSVQYDKTSIADTWDLSGTLISKVEVEGSPDIQVTLSTPHEWAGLEDIVYHPIVHADDAHHRGNQWKVRYSAPLESTSLLHYSVTALPCLPIRGFYQMKGDSSVRLLVQLKLNEGVKNYFEFCEVHIPFFNRGVIERLDSIVPSNLAASLALSKDNKSIVWAIGQRFPVRGLELSLQATVHFKEGPEENKPFFVGSNSYIEVFFKMPEFTLSGATVDSKSVTLFPSSKPKVVISRELYTSSYRVWNSHGDVLATYPQYRTQ